MKRPTLPVAVGVLVAALSVVTSLGLLELGLKISNYQFRKHNWIFQNSEFIQDTEYFNFFTLDRHELFVPRKQTLIAPNYWQTDAQGFRHNPAHFGDQSRLVAAAYNQKLLRCDVPFYVVVLGDSIAYGHGVRNGAAWPAQLEANFQMAGFPAIVLNAAVPASTTDQQFLRLKRMVGEYHPKWVVWMVNYNDMSESNLTCLTKLVGKRLVVFPAFFNIAYSNAWFSKHLPTWITKTRVGNLLTTLTIAGKDFFTIGCSFADYDKNDFNEQRVYFKKLPVILTQSEQIVQAEGGEILFVLTPLQAYFDPAKQNNDYMFQFFDQYRTILQSSGVEWIDMTKELAKIVDQNIVWNREGRRIASRYTAIPANDWRVGTPYIDYFLDERIEGRPYDGAYHPNELANSLMSQVLYQSLVTRYAQ